VLVSRMHQIGFKKPTLGRNFLVRAMLFVLCKVLDHIVIDLSKTEDYWKICDLQHIMHSLVNVDKVGDNNLDQRCWVGMSSNCIGRGGEIKFQDYTDWKFDYQLSVTDAKWSETKKISS
jgi:hypothetical protein